MRHDDPEAKRHLFMGRLGPYRIGRRIGSGGMGVVYEGARAGLGRPVAIKVLRRRWMTDASIRRDFREEGLLASAARHPNLAAVIDRGEADDGVPYLVMERVWGEPLSTVVAREGALEPWRAAEITAQVLGGVDALHRAGLVHADIKSANVMIETGDDGSARAKLIDFGLVRREPLPGTRIAEDVVTGTPHYMAPEVIRGRGVSAASDIYAVGALLYELLTGQPPFAGRSGPEVLAAHLAAEVVAPSVAAPSRGIPERLDAITMQALQKWRMARHPSAAAFAAALIAAMAGLPPVERRPIALATEAADALPTLDWAAEPTAHVA